MEFYREIYVLWAPWTDFVARSPYAVTSFQIILFHAVEIQVIRQVSNLIVEARFNSASTCSA
jgi:hypothetical protein